MGRYYEGYKNALCISGTHGKTTTTSMATHIFMAAQKDPTVMIGGTLQLLHSGYRVGKGDTIIAESCEYCNSFLSFFPTVAVILNVEADHLDFFKDLADVEHSFRRFAELVPIGGHVVANMDDQARAMRSGAFPSRSSGSAMTIPPRSAARKTSSGRTGFRALTSISAAVTTLMFPCAWAASTT